MPAKKKIPTSRAARSAMLGRVVAGQAARQVGTKIATAGRSAEYRSATLQKRQAEAAKALVTGLGTMRGAAMKIGQMMSMFDIGLWPEEMREDMQRAMATLQNSAPPVAFDKMTRVIENDLGRGVDAVFADFDTTPIAAASIGQVYRAVLRESGAQVAVKVQYPGVDKAVRSDLRNLSLVFKAAKVLVPNMDWAALTEEIRDRIEEELDYELEARNQHLAARLYLDHPFIVIPDVFTELSGQRVLVTEFIEGDRFEQVKGRPVGEVDRIAEIVFRFYFGGLFTHRQFSPDPHPGNFLVTAYGRVAFLDFGLYKRLDRTAFEEQRALMRGIVEGTPDSVYQAFVTAGIAATDAVPPQQAFDFAQRLFWWAQHRGPLTIEQDAVNAMMAGMIDPTASQFTFSRKQSADSTTVLAARMMGMVVAALGQLEATGDWNAILREMLFDEAPATDLGTLDAEFRSLRGPAAIIRPDRTGAHRESH
ncbi:ABC1 kinase family protein [Nocardia crassostreae]|uniref:ABC1 kinase family protein n=1 Tax=Nocardia crassostreae TaxID=53428 RepID=UPI000832635A|nr:AarF/ABC1/UbiB kinase family protein [Nocardia crassostreae]